MDLASDVRFGFRNFAKTPVFTVVALLSLALGIGANTAIFSIIDQLVLRLLPVKDPQQLVLLDSDGNHYGNNRGANSFSHPMYEDFRQRNQVFSGLLCRFSNPVSMSYGGHTERASGELVSGNYFKVLGVTTAIGRTIAPEDDDLPLAHPVAMLSYRYWQNHFAADPSILNRTVVVNGHNMTVIGVVQRGYDGLEPGSATQVFVPVMMKAWMTPGWDDMKDRRSTWVNLFGRLKPGVSPAQAKASMQILFHQIIEQEIKAPDFRNASAYTRQQFLKSTITVIPAATGRSFLREQMTTPLVVLMAIVALVLLIACGNVANLLLARAAGRQREIAIRLALGAGRWQIMRQLLVESVMLSLAGGLAGVAVACVGVRLLLGFMPQGDSPILISALPDGRILLFNFAVALFTGVLFGLAPALQATRPDVAPTLKDQAGAVAGSGHARLRKTLVISQVTLSLLLLVGAGLFLRSLKNLRDLGPGFQTGNLVAFAVDPSLNGYGVPRSLQFFHELKRNLSGMPGVQSAGGAVVGILQGNEWDSSMTVEGYNSKPGENMNPQCNAITPGYFATLGIPVLEGRDFNDSDTGLIQHRDLPFKVPNVVVVNEKFAKHYFGNRNALGRRIGFGNDPGTPADMEIVGVVKDTKYTAIRDETSRQIFFPYMKMPFINEMTVYVRSPLSSDQVAGMVRREVARMDRNLPIFNLRTVESTIDASLLNERLVANLSAIFGGLATLLAMVGLYGVMAYTVAQRTREIGIRVALGAKRGNVVWLVMKEAALMVGFGLAIGLPAAWACSRLVTKLLYGIEPADPVSIASAIVLLAVIASLAGYIPAVRASRIDPIRALRYE